MANPEHIEILKSGHADLVRWRMSHPSEKMDLTGADLAGINLCCEHTGGESKWAVFPQRTQLKTQGIDLPAFAVLSPLTTPADLTDCIFTGANLRGAKLRNTCFRNADLSNSSLKFADIRYSELENANLEGADLSSVDFKKA